MSNLFEDRIYVKSQGYPWQSIDEDTIIIDPKNQISHELSDVGTFVWTLLDGKNTCREIVTDICSTYEVSEQIAADDLKELLEDLKNKALIAEV